MNIDKNYAMIGVIIGLLTGFLLGWLIGIPVMLVIGLILYFANKNKGKEDEGLSFLVFGIVGAVIGGILAGLFLVAFFDW